MRNFIFLLVFLIIASSANINAQWMQVSSGIGDQDVMSLATNHNTIFAGTRYNGLYLSNNNGSNWIQANLGAQSVYSLAVNGNNIFAGANGVYLSVNNGTTWTHTSFNNRGVYSLAINGSNIFAGSSF